MKTIAITVALIVAALATAAFGYSPPPGEQCWAPQPFCTPAPAEAPAVPVKHRVHHRTPAVHKAPVEAPAVPVEAPAPAPAPKHHHAPAHHTAPTVTPIAAPTQVLPVAPQGGGFFRRAFFTSIDLLAVVGIFMLIVHFFGPMIKSWLQALLVKAEAKAKTVEAEVVAEAKAKVETIAADVAKAV